MKKILIITIFFFSIYVSAQYSKYSLKYNYGLNIALQSDLIGVCMDCNANTIGTVGNLELEYKISTSESIGFGVTMTENKNKNEYKIFNAVSAYFSNGILTGFCFWIRL